MGEDGWTRGFRRRPGHAHPPFLRPALLPFPLVLPLRSPDDRIRIRLACPAARSLGRYLRDAPHVDPGGREGAAGARAGR